MVLAVAVKNAVKHINKSSYNNALQEIYFHHTDQNGYVGLCYLDNGQTEKQKHFTLEELPTALEAYMNNYNNVCFTQNTFRRKSRKSKYIKTLSALYVDIDCYNKGYSATEALSMIKSYFGKQVPIPNTLKFSGAGLTLIWLLEEANDQKLWKEVAGGLITYFEKLNIGVDRKSSIDDTRVFRISGTINSKYNVAVETEVIHDVRFNLEEIKKNWCNLFKVTPPLTTEKVDQKKMSVHHKQTPKKNISKKINNKVKYLHTEYSLFLARCEDLKTLCTLGKFDIQGKREFALFLYRHWLRSAGESEAEALNETLKLNSMFGLPLDETEVIGATSSEGKLAEGTKYKYENATLIKLLEITEEEQKHLKTIISKEEVKRRDREYRRIKRDGTSREEYLQKEASFTNKQLQYLRSVLQEQPNIKKTKLAEMMGIGRTRLYALLKQL